MKYICNAQFVKTAPSSSPQYPELYFENYLSGKQEIDPEFLLNVSTDKTRRQLDDDLHFVLLSVDHISQRLVFPVLMWEESRMKSAL